MTVREKVEADFQVKGADKAASALSGVASAGGPVAGILSSVLGVVNPLNLAFTALGATGALYGVARIGGQFESMQISMAQTLRFMGQGGETWNNAMSNAESTIRRVEAAAAALPGEAEDYSTALSLAGSAVNRATGDFDRTFNLIKQSTAVGISMGANAAFTAVQLNRMLNSQRGMMTSIGQFSTKLLRAMQHLPGQANLTAAAFNRMDLSHRLDLVTRSMGQFNEMVTASSNTWDAVIGASATAAKTLGRLATSGVFNAMKTQLGRVNDMLMSSDGTLTHTARVLVQVGQFIGGGISKALEGVVDILERISEASEGWLRSLATSPALRMLSSAAERLSGAFSQADTPGSQAGVAGAAVGGGVAAAMGAGGPVGLLIAGLVGGFADFLTRVDAVTSVLNSLAGIVDSVSTVFAPLVEFAMALSGIFGDMFEAILPPLFEGFQRMSAVIFPVVGALVHVAATLLTAVRPAFMLLWHAIGKVIQAYYRIQANALKPIGLAIIEVALWLSQHLQPAISAIVGAFSTLIDAIGDVVSWIADVTDSAVRSIGEATAHENAPEWYRTAREALLSLGNASGTGEGGMAAGGTAEPASPARLQRRGGGNTHQDFRFSRFEIQQKFAEGFDPDRIAVAFASDVGRLGEQRLQSGFEPLFGVA